jgi:coenzyme F420-0:L-glutamate ligase/coenzyme F420-1:gamma-L-glutamate ligase
MANELRIVPVVGMGEVRPGDDLAGLLLSALERQGERLAGGDVLVVTQKIVSKAEGRIVNPDDVEPSAFAHSIAQQGRKDARYYEVVLREAARIVRMDRGVLICETRQGLICANAGVDESNVGGGHVVTLLPEDSDRSAAALRGMLHERTGADVAVIISDTFGRPWRDGQVNIAIGVAGMQAIHDYRGQPDSYGYEMHATLIAVADELAAAGELVMNKTDQVPIALIRGYRYQPAAGTAQALVRDPAKDMFR